MSATLFEQQPIGHPWRGTVYPPSARLAPVPDRQSRANYVVMLTAGDGDGGKRATLAFAAACAALSLDLDTHVFLVGDGSHWAYEGNSDAVAATGFPRLSELMRDFTELGGEIYVCATCDKVCSAPGTAAQPSKRRVDIRPQGLASVMSHMIGGNSITF
jgi:predicted peroxiredoxin